MKASNNMLTGCLLILAGLYAGGAQAVSPIDIRLTTAKPVFTDTEPLEVLIEVTNTSGADAYVTKGFFEGDFHLDLELKGPDGRDIRPLSTVGSPEPLGPLNLLDSEGIPRPATPCERIPPYDPVTGDGRTFRLIDLETYYPITLTGAYSAIVKTPVEVFSDFVELGDTGEVFCFLDDPEREAFNPLLSNKISFSIEPAIPPVQTQIDVSATLFNVGSGNKPKVGKTPINRMRIEMYALAEVPDDLKPVNHKMYALVSGSDLVGPVQVRFTGSDGRAAFGPVPQSDYVLIGIYRDSTDTRFVGAKIAVDDANWATQIRKKLNVMILPNGDKVTGKTRRLTGSELLITQPEYIEWDSSEELYPFIFESEGEWGVTTTVEPPEGFVADQDALSATVDNELEAVQFTVTDIGSDWVETGVTYPIAHTNNTNTIQHTHSKNLEQNRAKKKNLGLHGETEAPGDFVGGKTVNKTENTKRDGSKKDKQ